MPAAQGYSDARGIDAARTAVAGSFVLCMQRRAAARVLLASGFSWPAACRMRSDAAVAAAPALPILFERDIEPPGLASARQLPLTRRANHHAGMEMARRVSVTASAAGPQRVDHVA
jgi:hypothetical protein